MAYRELLKLCAKNEDRELLESRIVIVNMVVCTPVIIGHATAVYYVRASCKYYMICIIAWVRRFVKVNPRENLIFRFLEPIREILSPRKFQEIAVFTYTYYSPITKKHLIFSALFLILLPTYYS